MGYAPVSTIVTPPDPPDGGTVFGIEFDTGPRFPTPPFEALVWPINTVPDIGVDSEKPTVIAIDMDTVTVIRGIETIDFDAGMCFAALNAVPVFEVDEVTTLTPDVDGSTVIIQVRDPDGTFTEYTSDGTTDVVLDADGFWHWRAVADEHTVGPEHAIFVKFSEVV